MRLVRREGSRLDSLNYVFCSDDFLFRFNQRFLDHHTYTDILTFPFHQEGEPILADIYISTDRVKDNAQNLDITFYNELLRVIFHGALHLCGYSDKTQNEQALMRKTEDQYLEKFFRST